MLRGVSIFFIPYLYSIIDSILSIRALNWLSDITGPGPKTSQYVPHHINIAELTF